jgi:hypothetical protein
MSGAVRSAPFRGVLVMGAGLLLLATCVAVPAFAHGQAATILPGSAAFAAQWGSIEPVVPNFWGPANQPAMQEPYVEATGGARLVQYFDKARMEQTTAGGPVTNGLLTVELITGQRQFGDRSFAAFPPSSLPVVGDLTNAWPPYAALNSTVFAARVPRSGEPVGMVYKPDGIFGLNPGLAAQPGAAFGDYQGDPGGRYAHNIPAAFASYLAALPLPWQSAMGFPLTEAFWVIVAVNAAPTWVLVQPFERRVLSYTPTNPTAFQVEMGNIGQHYYQWRYATGASDDPPASAATAATNAAASGTPAALAISSVQLGTATESTVSLTFHTSVAATTEILYGTSSHAYAFHQDISTSATHDHTVNLSGLQPGTKYYFALRATASGTSVQRAEDYFATLGAMSGQSGASSSPTTKVSAQTAATETAIAKATIQSATLIPKTVSLTMTQVTLNAKRSPAFAPSGIHLSGATVQLSLATEGAPSATIRTTNLTNWTVDEVNAIDSNVTAINPLSMADRQTTVTLTATLAIPFDDTTTPPLVVTFTRKLTSSEYESGVVISSPPLSNAHTPGYSVIFAFIIAVK